jgi:hypothetical protein
VLTASIIRIALGATTQKTAIFEAVHIRVFCRHAFTAGWSLDHDYSKKKLIVFQLHFVI